MVGRTNAGGVGSVSQWYAYIQVSTDANAIITAVNPAGNSYTRTADSTGALTIVVSYPGTYTISETGATSQTVVVADYGVAYNVTILVPPPVGMYIIQSGVPVQGMSAYAALPTSASVSHDTPYAIKGVPKTNPVTHEIDDWVLVQQSNQNSGGCYVTQSKISTAGYSTLNINMIYDQPYANLYFGLYSTISGGWMTVVASTQAQYQTSGGISTTLNIAGSSSVGDVYIGVYVINDSSHSNTNAYIRDLYLS